jgi:hypothetical protein
MRATVSNPTDMMEARRAFGAACGPGALAALLSIPVRVVCLDLFSRDLRDGIAWINIPRMQRALADSGRVSTCRSLGNSWPEHGLAMIQWQGPWMRVAVLACTHRHWVAVNGGLIWDANLEDWVPRPEWEAFINANLPEKASGWALSHGYEIEVQG